MLTKVDLFIGKEITAMRHYLQLKVVSKLN